ncbi:MAG: NADH-quinone oxidoreductase subunit M [Pseudomonadota bacterium]
MENVLSIITFLPLIAAFFMAIIKGDDAEAQGNAKWLALAATGFTFVISLALLFQVEIGLPGYQLVEERAWLFGLSYKLGIDGLSLVFVLLTTFLMPLVVVSCWRMTARVKDLMMALLVLQSLLLGSFLALDLVLFFVFAQGALIPVFLIVSFWGAPGGATAALKFLLVALLGGALMLAAIVSIGQEVASADLEVLAGHNFSAEPIMLLGIEVIGGRQTLLFLAFFLAFAIYLGLWPLHTWLPDALAEAPQAGGLVIAALVTKIGGYGLLRIALPLFPQAEAFWAPIILWIAVAGVLWAGLAAFSATDLRRLLGYGTVALGGLVVIGVFSGGVQGIDGAVILMLSHALSLAALFIGLIALQDRLEDGQASDTAHLGGLVVRMPALTALMVAFLLALIGLPGSGAFIGTFLVLLSAVQAQLWVAVLAGLTLILSAGAALGYARHALFGDMIREGVKSLGDLNLRERAIFVPLLVASLGLGLMPSLALETVAPTIDETMAPREDLRSAGETLRLEVPGAEGQGASED